MGWREKVTRKEDKFLVHFSLFESSQESWSPSYDNWLVTILLFSLSLIFRKCSLFNIVYVIEVDNLEIWPSQEIFFALQLCRVYLYCQIDLFSQTTAAYHL